MGLASSEWLGLPVKVQRAGRPPSEPIRSEVPFLDDWRAWASGVGAHKLATMPGSAGVGHGLPCSRVPSLEKGSCRPRRGATWEDESLEVEPPRRGVLRLETAGPSRPNV